jgi:hypothetical protein
VINNRTQDFEKQQLRGFTMTAVFIRSKFLQNGSFWLLLLAFLAMIVDLTLFNWFRMEYFLNSDTIADGIKAARAIYEHGLLFNEYAPSHELGQSRPWFITLPAYLITGSWLVACRITLIITSLLIILLFSLLLKRLELGINAVLFTDIALIGINFGSINSLRFTYAYSVFVISTLFFLILYMDVFIRYSSKFRRLKISVMLVIAFVGGTFGIRHSLILVLPLFVIEVGRFLWNARGSRDDKILQMILSCKPLLFAGAILIANIFGVALYKLYSIWTYNNSLSFAFSAPKDTIYDIIENIAILFNQLCIYGNVPLSNLRMSGELMLRLFVYALIIIGGVWILRKKRNQSLNFIIVFFLTTVILTFVVCSATTMLNGSRYYMLVWYLIMVILAVLFEKMETKLYKTILVFSVFALVLLSLVNNEWRKPADIGLDHPLRQVSAYLVKNDFDVVFADVGNSSLLEGLSDEKLKAAHFMWGGTSFIPLIWLTDASLYYDNAIDDQKIAVVFTDAEEETFLSSAPQIDLDQLARAEKVTEIADRNIYAFDFNPVSAFKMPKFKGQSQEYFFSKRYAGKVSDHIDYNERYIDCSAEGSVAWGPYVKASKGIYEITANYEYLEYNGPCVFYLANQHEILFQIELPNGYPTFRLSNIDLGETKDLLEFKVDNPNQSKIRLKSIVVEKIK